MFLEMTGDVSLCLLRNSQHNIIFSARMQYLRLGFNDVLIKNRQLLHVLPTKRCFMMRDSVITFSISLH